MVNQDFLRRFAFQSAKSSRNSTRSLLYLLVVIDWYVTLIGKIGLTLFLSFHDRLKVLLQWNIIPRVINIKCVNSILLSEPVSIISKHEGTLLDNTRNNRWLVARCRKGAANVALIIYENRGQQIIYRNVLFKDLSS